MHYLFTLSTRHSYIMIMPCLSGTFIVTTEDSVLTSRAINRLDFNVPTASTKVAATMLWHSYWKEAVRGYYVSDQLI